MNTCIVMPAYNAGKTLEQTYFDIPEELRNNIILVDDYSTDNTVEVAERLNIRVIRHDTNRGYGANQQTCYDAALKTPCEIVIMLHPDYQYDARVCGIMAQIISYGNCDVVLGNRIRTRKEALKGGMPVWKYVVNRLSTFGENLILGQSIGDFHSGFRAYSRTVLETIPYNQNNEDFGFDQEFLIQCVYFNFKIGDIPVPVRYFEDSSSINWFRSISYGLVGMGAIVKYMLQRLGIRNSLLFQRKA